MKKLVFLACCILFLSCNNKTVKGKSIPASDTHTSANSLDWQGTYKGTLPCADCQGIQTELTLNNDNTYVLSTKYLGKDSISNVENGSFSWNKEGNAITLADAKNKPGQYFVGENRVTQLDMSGNKITGALTDNYILAKQPANLNTDKKSSAQLVETYWRLTELMGKPVPHVQGAREMHLILKQQDNRFQAFAGCNNIMGSFESNEGSLIRFLNVASTKMACNEMTIENEFKEMLGKADNYSILGDKLSLNKARMAPLARFEAVNQ